METRAGWCSKVCSIWMCMPQEDLALEAATERSYIGDLERDTRGPAVRALARLAEPLAVSSTHTENGSNIRPSNIGACNTAISPLNIIPRRGPCLAKPRYTVRQIF